MPACLRPRHELRGPLRLQVSNFAASDRAKHGLLPAAWHVTVEQEMAFTIVNLACLTKPCPFGHAIQDQVKLADGLELSLISAKGTCSRANA